MVLYLKSIRDDFYADNSIKAGKVIQDAINVINPLDSLNSIEEKEDARVNMISGKTNETFVDTFHEGFRMGYESAEKIYKDELIKVSAVAYQVVGALSEEHGDIFESDEVQSVLDYFSKYQFGGMFADDPLPFNIEE